MLADFQARMHDDDAVTGGIMGVWRGNGTWRTKQTGAGLRAEEGGGKDGHRFAEGDNMSAEATCQSVFLIFLRGLDCA